MQRPARQRSAATAASPAPGHRCHAQGCTTPIPAKLFLCLPHWRKVPRDLKRRLWANYRWGQEVDKRPSEAWLEAAAAVIQAVALAERGG